jgi:hypothetical protein
VSEPRAFQEIAIMCSFVRPLILAAAGGAVVLGISAPAPAQFVAPAARLAWGGTVANNLQARAAVTGFGAGFQTGTAANSAFGWNPYGWPGSGYYPGPVGGYLQGAADVISSQGQLMVNQQQAFQMKEQARQAQIQTRRQAFDEWLYERANTPTTEDDRERLIREQLRRSRNDPPVTEIWSARSLNDLLAAVQKSPPPPGQSTDVPLDPDVVRAINVTSRAGSGSLGLFREGGRLQWPLPLQDAAFEESRQQVNELVPQALKQAAAGSVDGGTIQDLNRAVRTMRDSLRAKVEDFGPNEYIGAMRYLNSLTDSIQRLSDPNVAKYLNGTWAARGNTVAELVQNMTAQGLRFAPATPGSENAYVALQRALATFESGGARLVAH